MSDSGELEMEEIDKYGICFGLGDNNYIAEKFLHEFLHSRP